MTQLLTYQTITKTPLPYMDSEGITRSLCRILAWVSRYYILDFKGLEKIGPEYDPFIIVPNHNMRVEAVLLPSMLAFHRRGKLIHFLADWQFLMVPLIATLYRRSRIIPIARKDAKPKFLNIFKRFFDRGNALDIAKEKIQIGRSIGIFPEGTMNRNTNQLLRGHFGAARLALETGVKLIPAGLEFPEVPMGDTIRDSSKMCIHIGDPISPSGLSANNNHIRQLHEQVMTQIAVLSNKSWSWDAPKRRIHG